jgi:hypothetical protein
VDFSVADPGAIWVPEDRSAGDEIAGIIDRMRRERQQRRSRSTIGFSDRAAEDFLENLRIGGMRPDEYLHALCRHGVYVACRKVDTIHRALAREAGL